MQAATAVNTIALSAPVVLIDGERAEDVARYRVCGDGCFAIDSAKPNVGGRRNLAVSPQRPAERVAAR